MQRLLAVGEVADVLGVHARTVRRLISGGTLPHIRIGTRVMVPADALDDWIRAHTQGVSA